MWKGSSWQSLPVKWLQTGCEGKWKNVICAESLNINCKWKMEQMRPFLYDFNNALSSRQKSSMLNPWKSQFSYKWHHVPNIYLGKHSSTPGVIPPPPVPQSYLMLPVQSAIKSSLASPGHESKQWGFLIAEVKNKKRLMIAPICNGYVCLKRGNSGRQDAIVHAGLSADFPLWANLSAGSSVVLTLLQWTKKRLAR